VQQQDFDFDMTFLDPYVQVQVAQGKKEYDVRRRQTFGDTNGMDLVPATSLQFQHRGEKGLNFKPYEQPNRSGVNTEV
jgi:hypothetical protein